jgi:hypothetical protein
MSVLPGLPIPIRSENDGRTSRAFEETRKSRRRGSSFGGEPLRPEPAMFYRGETRRRDYSFKHYHG